MTRNEKDADFYRDDLADDRTLRPIMVALIAIVAAWTLIYLLGGATGGVSTNAGARLAISSSVVSVVEP